MTEHRHNVLRIETPPLLKTESREEFEAFRKNFHDEIKPEGAIEQMYADEFVCILWEILRLRRSKASMIDAGMRRALQNLLDHICGEASGIYDDVADSTEDVSVLYFRNARVKKTVLEIMHPFQLDEAAIEAQAIRDALRSLEVVDAMLESLEKRRNRALSSIAQYREALAWRMRNSANCRLGSEKLPQLADSSQAKLAP